MATGTVKWSHSAMGFGFIAPRGGSEEVFVQISAVGIVAGEIVILLAGQCRVSGL